MWKRTPVPVPAAVVLVALVLGAGCADGDDQGRETDGGPTTGASGGPGTPPTAEQDPAGGSSEAPSGREGPVDLGRLEVVAEGLEVPWDVAFVDGDTLLLTERPGRLRLVEAGRLRAEPLVELDAGGQGEGGLLGVALHPDFGRERWVYLYLTTDQDNRVLRYPVGDGMALGQPEVVLEGIPRSRFHNGGGLGFGPDGLLYVSTGDASQPELAADLASLAGKVLRLTPEGEVPPSNPFGSAVYSWGHRNPQGFDWDDQGRLYVAEHGPSGEFGLCCNDEVNQVEAGRFYGWPFRAGRVAASGGRPPAEPVPPAADSDQATWAPSGLAVDPGGGDAPPSLLVANLAGRGVLRLPLLPDGSVAATEVALDGDDRFRASQMGPDGCLYLTTSNTDGRGSVGPGDDRLLRACPASGGQDV